MTTLTVVSCLLLLLGALTRNGYTTVLGLGGATPAGAALVLGGIAVPTFYFVALGAVCCVALWFVSGATRSHWVLQAHVGVSFLWLFLGWSTLVTLLAPFLFDGLMTHVAGQPQSTLASGVVTSSNIAQIGYFAVGLLVVSYLSRRPGLSINPSIVGTALGATTVLCLWAYTHQQFGVPYPEKTFDNSPTFKYISTASGGAERFRGIFSEPAGLALSNVTTAAYMVSRAVNVQGLRRLGAIVMAAIAIFLGSISTSATFVVGGIAVAIVAVTISVAMFLVQRSVVSTLIGFIGPIVVLVGLWFLPTIANFAGTAIEGKVGTDSYDERGQLDTLAYSLLGDTGGVGVGLGANRASSFFATLLSTTGLLGTSLFLAGVGLVLVRGWQAKPVRPAGWALIAFLVVKVVSGPDLSDTSGIMWLCLGVLVAGSAKPGKIANELHEGGVVSSRAPEAVPTGVARRDLFQRFGGN